MSDPGERVLILAPLGRDAAVAAQLLTEAGMPSDRCAGLVELVGQLDQGVGAVFITQEALRTADLNPLASWIAAQPSWSDLPFVVATERGGGPERTPASLRLMDALGNVTLLERPFQPATLVSVMRTGLRSRRRQYEAAGRLRELARRERALRDSEAAERVSRARLSFALEAGRLGAWELDEASGKLTCSDICKAAFGRTPAQAFNRSDLLAAIHAQERDGLAEAIRQALRDGGDCVMEARTVWPDGSLHWVELRGRAVREDGRPTWMSGVLLDVTERKRAELELREHRERLQERVDERTAELAAALARLRDEVRERERTEEALRQSQKMEAIGQLTGGIAHDFNNLLTGISGSMELMQTRLAQGRTAELGRYVGAASDLVERAASLTHRLLAFARRQTLELREVDVNKLAFGMEDLLRRTAGPSVRIEFALARGLWSTLCDDNQLESALLNLCINARDAMPDGGRLTIETANVELSTADLGAADDGPPGQYVALSVTDTGTGMSDEIRARVFDPFFTTKPIGQGTGLGLSMVYGFVKQSHGHMRVDSAPGRGTTMRMYLPWHVGGGAVTGAAEMAAEEAAVDAERRVLVVEDEPVVRALILETLEELGYRTMEAADGPSGLRLLRSAAPLHLLVTDVGLPGMDGRQLAYAGREVRPDLKVLFITGYAHDAAVGNHVLDAGMHLIAKPFALDALAAKVRAVMGA